MSKHPEQVNSPQGTTTFPHERRESRGSNGSLKRVYEDYDNDGHQQSTFKGVTLPSCSDLALGAEQWVASGSSRHSSQGHSALLPSIVSAADHSPPFYQSSNRRPSSHFLTRSPSDPENSYAGHAQHASSTISRMVRTNTVPEYEEDDNVPSKRRRSSRESMRDSMADSFSTRTASNFPAAVVRDESSSAPERSAWNHRTSDGFDWRSSSSRSYLRVSPNTSQMQRRFSREDTSRYSEGFRPMLPSNTLFPSGLPTKHSPPSGAFADESRRITGKYSDLRTTSNSHSNNNSSGDSRRASPDAPQPFNRYEPLSLSGCPAQRYSGRTSPAAAQAYRSSEAADRQQPRSTGGHSSEHHAHISPSTSRAGSDRDYDQRSPGYHEQHHFPSSSASGATSPPSLPSPHGDPSSFSRYRSGSMDSGRQLSSLFVSHLSGLAHDEGGRRIRHVYDPPADASVNHASHEQYQQQQVRPSTNHSSNAHRSWSYVNALPAASASYHNNSGPTSNSAFRSQESSNPVMSSARILTHLTYPDHAAPHAQEPHGMSNSSSKGSIGTNDDSQANQLEPDLDSDNGTVPRRGNFPRQVTEYLRQWLFTHRDHPYPSDQEKRDMAQYTNLDLRQLNNWFINARRRVLRNAEDDAQQQGGVATAEE
ncbi:hypothetical protein A4X09_0g4114 [Tilletia walkeri]|uniref:Homeobox domain-containing protein n=1 Tax=Tilletia walkeri TaxID=117179 RepID=A0A8X7N9P6_9BASI|nr:hypothetical protein A4X09_0g4114 [Tilletia walkeri]